MPGGSALIFHADVYKKAAFEFLVPNQPLEGEDGYSVVNASLSYVSPDKKWEGQLFVTNLTDEEYKLGSINETPISLEAVTSSYARPREWGVRVRYNF